MKELQTKQPNTYKHLHSQGSVVRRSAKQNFNSISTDQALEQIVNLEVKSEGGIIGFTLRKGALLRGMLTRHINGEYAQSMRMFYSSDEEESHKELGASRQAKDVSDVKTIEDAIVNQYQNPFYLNTMPCKILSLVR